MTQHTEWQALSTAASMPEALARQPSPDRLANLDSYRTNIVNQSTDRTIVQSPLTRQSAPTTCTHVVVMTSLPLSIQIAQSIGIMTSAFLSGMFTC